MAISKLSDKKDKPQLMTMLLAPDSFGVLLSKYRKVVIYLLSSKKLYDTKIASELNILNEDLRTLSGRRTTVVHSFWSIGENGKLIRAKFKKDISSDAMVLEDKVVTMQSINILPEDIIIGEKKLRDFNAKVLQLLGL